MRHRVDLVQTVRQFVTLEVEADDERSARRKAEAEAGEVPSESLDTIELGWATDRVEPLEEESCPS